MKKDMGERSVLTPVFEIHHRCDMKIWWEYSLGRECSRGVHCGMLEKLLRPGKVYCTHDCVGVGDILPCNVISVNVYILCNVMKYVVKKVIGYRIGTFEP